MKNRKELPRLDDGHEQAIGYLQDALHRIERPSPNANGYPMQAGGAWWRLQKVMAWLAPHVEKAGDTHVFAVHGYPEEGHEK